MADHVQLVTTKSDAEAANELQEHLAAAYEPICRLMEQATAAGFMVSVGLGPNAFGKFQITQIMIAKKLFPA